MAEEKKTVWEWIKAHKKELIIAGISIGALIAAIVLYKNRKQLAQFWAMIRKGLESAPEALTETMPATVLEKVQTAEIIPFKAPAAEEIIEYTEAAHKVAHAVSSHVRKLPKGWKASTEKLIEAELLGIKLKPGETLVCSYTTGGLAA